MNKRKIGFIEIRESTEGSASAQTFPTKPEEQIPNICKVIRPHFDGIIIGNDQFDEKTGIEKIRSGDCDMISFGRKYVCNPDLAERILKGQEISNTFDWYTAFRGMNYENLGAKGYTDYPTFEQLQ